MGLSMKELFELKDIRDEAYHQPLSINRMTSMIDYITYDIIKKKTIITELEEQNKKDNENYIAELRYEIEKAEYVLGLKATEPIPYWKKGE